jgi:hypothetical protein
MFININNSWQTVTKMFVNVNGSWQSTAKGYSNINGVWQLIYNIVTTITDTFTRTTSGSLGTSDSGTLWNALRGVWSANGSQATSADTESTYPIASATFAADATLSADVSGGTGLAFWITDANNWWAAYPNYTTSTGSSTCTGGTVYCYSAGCTPGGSCGTISQSVSYSCPSGYYGPNFDIFGNPICNDNLNPFNTIPATTSYTRSSASLVAGATTYDTYVSIISSVSGTVNLQSTALFSSGSGSLNPVGSLRVIISGNQITTRAYNGTGLTSQMGSDNIIVVSSPAITATSVGIIKAPCTYLQGNTIDNFSAT